jgi:hypothetical protein
VSSPSTKLWMTHDDVAYLRYALLLTVAHHPGDARAHRLIKRLDDAAIRVSEKAVGRAAGRRSGDGAS